MIEQSELRQAARKLLADIVTANSLGAWHKITEAGWPALTAPESLGGLDQPLESCCWLYMEMGAALSPVPLIASLLVVATLTTCKPSPIRNAWLERIAAGDQLAVSLLCPTRNSGKPTKLRAVLNADRTTHALIIFADEPLIAIAPLLAGHAIPRATWDATRSLSDLDIGNLQLDDSTIIARGAAAEVARTAFSTHLHIAIAADCIGAANKILDETVSYLKTRRQFGRPLAMFQALKHRCADHKAKILAAEALLLEYAAHIGANHRDSETLAKSAKSIASAAFRAMAEDAMQLHGGISMAAEHPCHMYLKRALLNEQLGSQNDDCDIAAGRALVQSLAA